MLKYFFVISTFNAIPFLEHIGVRDICVDHVVSWCCSEPFLFFLISTMPQSPQPRALILIPILLLGK